MLILLAVDANGCRCTGTEVTLDQAGECRKHLKCLKEYRSECSEDYHIFMEQLFIDSECQVTKLCAMDAGFLGVLKFMREGIQKDQLDETLRSILNKAYPCMVEQEKTNNNCTNEVTARQCFRKVFKKDECRDAILQECKVKGIRGMYIANNI